VTRPPAGCPTVGRAGGWCRGGHGSAVCQSLGFKGFQAAKIALAQDLVPFAGRPQEDIEAGHSPAQVLVKLSASSDDAMRLAPASVDPGEPACAVQLLRDAPPGAVLGVGSSAPLAQDAAYRLLTLGIPAEPPADVHVQHVRARLVSPRSS
jgi:DNA-binding MurR/RpiR family transcriptional regulator